MNDINYKKLQAGCNITKADFMAWSGETDISSPRLQTSSENDRKKKVEVSDDGSLMSESIDLDSFISTDDIVEQFREAAAKLENG